jgi:hypothetical protein
MPDMDQPGRFALVLVAADDYADPPGHLPSSKSAQRVAALLRECGGLITQQVVVSRADEVRTALARWAKHDGGSPLSSFLYLVGHGQSDGEDHWFLLPETSEQPSIADAIQTRTLGKILQQDWQHRQGDPASWAVLVLDCCASDIGVNNLLVDLAGKLNRPRNLALWPVSSRGASHAGRFVETLEYCLGTFSVNDTRIPVQELGRRIAAKLGDVHPDGFLSDDAALENPLRSEVPLTIGVDAYDELKRAVAKLPQEVRSHFLTKAQGAEMGELAWHFCGRDAEIAGLSLWLRDADRGLRVVTGEAGSGKSAVLGQLVVRANEELMGSMVQAGLVTTRPDAQSLPVGVFDAVMHLTGKTLAESVRAVAAATRADGYGHEHGDVEAVLARMARSSRRLTVLADALDEALEPWRIANFLRRAASLDKVRVIVGTRRSLAEDPDRRGGDGTTELLDALGAGAGDLVVMERDPDAQAQYVRRRLLSLGSPYAGREGEVGAIAKQIAEFDHPFLFARLATTELLARPLLDPEDPALAGLLARGHQGLFAAAVARLGAVDPAVRALLYALAFARGRGLPQTSGIWVAVARAVRPDVTVTESDVQTTLEQAAAYITLDGEAGQSRYRLAHQTFVDHFRKRAGGEHRAVAAALRRLVDESGGWRVANYYSVRYLPEHLTADSDRTPPDSEGLAALVTDAGWLRRSLALLGALELSDVLAAAHRAVPLTAVDAVARALRRSRLALDREPDELAAQMHARLKREDDPMLKRLLEGLNEVAPTTWLRVRTAGMSWRVDSATIYTMPGKVRALAFGRVGEQILLATGVEDQVVLWDPRLGSAEIVIGNDGGSVTALSVAEFAGRTVLVVADAARRIRLHDLRSHALVGPEISMLWDDVASVALGMLGERAVVAVAPRNEIWAWDMVSEDWTAVAVNLPGEFCSLTTVEGRLAINVQSRGGENWSSVINAQSGVPFWPPKLLGASARWLLVSTEVSGRLLSAACVPLGYVHAWHPATGEDAGGTADLSFSSLRALAVGEVDGRVVIAAAVDDEGPGLVHLRQTEEDTAQARYTGTGWHDDAPVWSLCAGSDNSVLALAGRRLRLFEVKMSGQHVLVDNAPPPKRVAAVLTGTSAPLPAFSVLDHEGAHFITIDRRLIDMRLGREPEGRGLPIFSSETAECYALLNGRPVGAGCSGNEVWILDLHSQEILARLVVEKRKLRQGPFSDEATEAANVISPDSTGGQKELALSNEVTAVAIGRLGSSDVLAAVSDGQVDLWYIRDQQFRLWPRIHASRVAVVALGIIGKREVLATGSDVGVLIIWDLHIGKRLASVTLDSGIQGVWVVHGADMLGVMTRDCQLHLFDFVTISGEITEQQPGQDEVLPTALQDDEFEDHELE